MDQQPQQGCVGQRRTLSVRWEANTTPVRDKLSLDLVPPLGYLLPQTGTRKGSLCRRRATARPSFLLIPRCSSLLPPPWFYPTCLPPWLDFFFFSIFLLLLEMGSAANGAKETEGGGLDGSERQTSGVHLQIFCSSVNLTSFSKTLVSSSQRGTLLDLPPFSLSLYRPHPLCI